MNLYFYVPTSGEEKQHPSLNQALKQMKKADGGRVEHRDPDGKVIKSWNLDDAKRLLKESKILKEFDQKQVDNVKSARMSIYQNKVEGYRRRLAKVPKGSPAEAYYLKQIELNKQRMNENVRNAILKKLLC